MAMIKCKMCGGDLVLTPDATVAECEYCGSIQTIPTQDDEKKLVQFARADRLRRNCEFDKAAGVYESIVADFRQEAEAYWGLVLCKYGIEYVDDPATGKKVPTCHRSSFDSVMEDPNFEQTLENADVVARKVYREEAKAIEEIRKGIIEVSSKEDPYDIFICYKETAEDGGRTLDSVLAQDMYDALTEKGYRVFFSRITLEDKLGQEYEPYIFAALNSAKVMLAVGTDYEYFNAVWVKNEWSRYLKLMAAGQKKTLIPCYKGIDAYDMPKEFAKLQAQDMGKVGAMQDLLRGIDKILTTPKTVKVESGIQETDIQKSVIYNNALEKLKEKNKKKKIAAHKEAIEKLESIAGWKDVDEQLSNARLALKKLKRKRAAKRMAIPVVLAAIALVAYVSLQYIVMQNAYTAGEEYLSEYEYADTLRMWNRYPDFKDTAQRIEEVTNKIAQQDDAIIALVKGSDYESKYKVEFVVEGEDYKISLNSEISGTTYVNSGETTRGRRSWFSYSSSYASVAQEKRMKNFFDPETIDYTSSRRLYYDSDTQEYVGLITRQNGYAPVEVFRGRLEENGCFVVYNTEGTTYTLVPQVYTKDGEKISAEDMISWNEFDSYVGLFEETYCGSWYDEDGNWHMDIDAINRETCNVYIQEFGIEGTCKMEFSDVEAHIDLTEWGYGYLYLFAMEDGMIEVKAEQEALASLNRTYTR